MLENKEKMMLSDEEVENVNGGYRIGDLKYKHNQRVEFKLPNSSIIYRGVIAYVKDNVNSENQYKVGYLGNYSTDWPGSHNYLVIVNESWIISAT